MMIIRNAFFVISLLAASFFSSASAHSDEGKRVVLNLQQCIQKAVSLSHEIGEVRHDVGIYKAKKMQADSASYPQIEVVALTGPAPEARIQHLSPVINTNVGTNINGIFGVAEAALIQPIYTFGKIAGYKESAERAVNAAKAGVDKKTSDVVLKVKEMYFGMLLGMEMRGLILEIKDELVDAIKKAERQIEIGSPQADEVNLYKLKAFLGEAQRNLNETEKGITLARYALMTYLGLKGDVDFDIAEKSLTPESKMPGEVRQHISNAFSLRPEFTQLREGLAARQALIEVEQSALYPHLFGGLAASIGAASNRDRIKNPYIFDYLNQSYAAAFIGMKWSFDFGITHGRIKEAEAEYNKLQEKMSFAQEMIPLQVVKAHLDLDEAAKNITEMEKAYRNAKKWLVAAVANFDMGIGEAKDIADAATAYAQMKANYIRSVYNHRMSYANLLYASGMDLKEIR
ncbi:MAG: TolC family protein [Nitrospirae bacterium]|nr:TolC family protein [Nitrospirota bacterium]